MKNNRAERITPHWPTRSDGRARFQALMAAVGDLLVDFGPAEITIQAISVRARVPKATVYTFFPSVEAALLAQAHVYLDGFSTLAKQPVEDTCNWQEAWRGAAARARDFFNIDVARMRLLLGPDVPSDVQTAGRSYVAEIGAAMANLLQSVQPIRISNFVDVCVHAIGINEMFWRLSFQTTGTINDTYFEEGMRASLAYLSTYLPPDPSLVV